MCGILGSWTNQPIARSVADAALSAIEHRGPDDEGRLFDGNVFLGMRRLAVIDLDGGQQPLWNETGDCAVVMNGEIYNYVELSRELRQRGHCLASDSDTVVVIDWCWPATDLARSRCIIRGPRMAGWFLRLS